MRVRLHKLFTKKITVSRFQLNLFGTIMLAIGAVIGSYLTFSKLLMPFVYASDTSQSWTFATSNDYTLSDSTVVEVAASSARLKVRNYSSDANTAALFHFDESSGNPTDSSSNANSATATSVTYSTGNLNNAAAFNGTSSYVSIADSSSTSLSQKNTIEAWTKFTNSFSSTSHNNHQGIVDKGEYKLYYNYQTGKLQYELADSGSTAWTQRAGNDLNGSWDLNGKTTVDAQAVMGTDLYIGLGTAVGDAEVWKYSTSGSTWTLIGGDGVNSSWADQTFESVLSMASDGTNVYAGLGTGTGDGEVWKWNGSTWSKIGGDAINSSWAVNTYEGVYSLTYANSTLYAGLGSSANDAEVWSWNGTSWTKIGGDSINSGWTTNFEAVYALRSDGTTYLYAGLGSTAGDAEVWRYSFSRGTWSRIGGDTVNSSWADATYEQVLSMEYQGSTLYVGLGNSASDAEVWSWNGTVWTQIGGDSLNSGWTTGYEGVYSLRGDGTNLYAGLGSTAGDNEVWSWNGTTWTKIGGDGINAGFSTTQTIVNTLSYVNSTLYAGLNAASTSSEVWGWNGTSWSQTGGNYYNNSWGFIGLHSVESMSVAQDKLYADTGVSTAGNALVWEFDGTNWTLIGGQGVNSSWAQKTYETVSSMVSFGGNLYVGLGVTANDAEVWKFDPTGRTWTQIGGDNLNSGWNTGYETVTSLAVFNGNLFAGLGSSAGDAEVYKYNGTTWSKVGGDSLNSGWTTNYESVLSMAVYQGNLYAGLGVSAGDAEVWKYNGTTWSKVAGDGINSGWDATFEDVDYLLPYNGKLYAGLGTTTDDAEVWEYNGSTWSKIGGDDLNGSWTSGTYEQVKSMTVYNGNLYAGLGNGTGDGEVWEYDGSTWSKVGGNSVNSSWTNAVEYVSSFSIYQGKLFAGTGNTANADAAVWSYGNNAVLKSISTSQDTNWHHIAATYDGATMKLYIDGVLNNSASASLSLPDTIHPVLVGTTYGARESGIAQGYFEGLY